MKAAQINEYGAKDVLKTVLDAPKPTADAGQVLVEVYAAAVNPFDWKVREGYMKDSVPLVFPATLGGDCAGVIAEIGEGVAGLQIGDAVYGQANALSSVGSYAEFTPVKADSLAPKPQSLDFVAAAALPLAGVSAYQALVEHINLQSGQKILIHGGAGGIGSIAIQIAKHLGAYVATTGLASDTDFLKKLGAHEIIDYKTQNFATLLYDYDAVYDTIGGETHVKSYQTLKPNGILVSMIEPPHEDLAKQFSVKAIMQSTQVSRDRLDKLTALVDQGAVAVHVSKTFPLEEANEALAFIQEGKQQGKVVLKIK